MADKYGLILADPPWRYRNYAARPGEVHNRARGAQKHYPTMTMNVLCNMPIADIAEDRAVLFMWATWPLISEALYLIETWGFVYKTLAWEWVKWNKNGLGVFVGMGHYTRSNPEPCLLAFKGDPIPVAARDVSAVLFSNLRRHSQKPAEQYDRIDRLYPQLAKLELFARNKRAGWASWGNEIESAIALPPYPPDAQRCKCNLEYRT